MFRVLSKDHATPTIERQESLSKVNKVMEGPTMNNEMINTS